MTQSGLCRICRRTRELSTIKKRRPKPPGSRQRRRWRATGKPSRRAFNLLLTLPVFKSERGEPFLQRGGECSSESLGGHSRQASQRSDRICFRSEGRGQFNREANEGRRRCGASEAQQALCAGTELVDGLEYGAGGNARLLRPGQSGGARCVQPRPLNASVAIVNVSGAQAGDRPARSWRATADAELLTSS